MGGLEFTDEGAHVSGGIVDIRGTDSSIVGLGRWAIEGESDGGA